MSVDTVDSSMRSPRWRQRGILCITRYFANMIRRADRTHIHNGTGNPANFIVRGVVAPGSGNPALHE